MRMHLACKKRNMGSPFVHRSLRLNLAATAVALLIAAPAFGALIVNDTFDSDAVGSTPAGWTFGDGLYGASTSMRYVTNNISSPPSPPNVLMFDTPNGTPGYLNTRSFATTALPADHPLVVSFDFRLDRIDNSYNGFIFDMLTANGSQQPFAHPRIAGGPGTYTLYSDSSQAQPLATGLATGTWHNLKFSINFTNDTGNGGSGYTEWTLDNTTFLLNQAFTLTSFNYTNIATVQFYDYAPGVGGERLFLDNVQVNDLAPIIPEPSTVLLLGAGACLFCRARHGRKA